MASLPNMQSFQPRAHNQQEESKPEASEKENKTPSMASEDSQTILLNPSGTELETGHYQDASSSQSYYQSRPNPPKRQSTAGIKKCWICICDATEDDPLAPPAWRTPCTCALTAHEACLLDWIADLENPASHKPRQSRILCPQCKTEIKISRPRNYVVDAVRQVDNYASMLVLPTVLLTLTGTLWAGLTVHGAWAVHVVCGENHAYQIARGGTRHYGWIMGYCLVPISLVAARTKYADHILPVGTLFLVSTQLSDGFEIDYTVWPPRASTVFACLPMVRRGYNWAYEKAFGELNRKWLKEVQPRLGENNEPQSQNAEEAIEEVEQEGGIVLELNLGIGGGDEEIFEEPIPEQQPAEGADGHVIREQAEPNREQRVLGGRAHDIIEGTSTFGQTAIGALLFPAVAAASGAMLGLMVPHAWLTNSNYYNGRFGFWRSRWGRSVIGGCTFVVLKDALVLYCRWQLAKSHRQRKVMDYDKAAKKYTLNA